MSEQLPPLNIDKDGKPESTFWAGERNKAVDGPDDDEADMTDDYVTTSREELARIALELDIPCAAKPPSEDGWSDTYLG